MKLENFETMTTRLRRLYIKLVKLGLAVAVLGALLLAFLAWIYPPYITHFSWGVSLAIYLIVGVLLGMNISMAAVMGKDWLKIAKAVQEGAKQ